MKRSFSWVLFWAAAGFATVASPVQSAPPDPQMLANQIDQFLSTRLKQENIPAAKIADDAEFLRRAYLDLTGRIPAPRDVYAFLLDRSPGKRAQLIDSLLETPRYASHSAAVWRAALAPEATALPEGRIFRTGFEAWLKQKFRAGVPYDQLVRELLKTPLSSDPEHPTPVLLRPDDPNPLAFFAVKDVKPENLAAVTTRVFLGVQIECAQCHNHPFAKWTREQFWNQAAFFAGLSRSGDGIFAPVSERLDVHEIGVGDTQKKARAKFLDERSPLAQTNGSLRGELADWVTAKNNPYFAKTAANRVWGQMFGRGIIDPVDDLHDDNPPSHPELLDALAKALVEADFDFRYLIRSIGRSQAYQRTSAFDHPKQKDPRHFSKMAVKGLTGEQLFDSLMQATGMRPGVGRPSGREAFLARFALMGKPADPESSIPQALALMNGKLIAEATSLATCPTLKAACELPGGTVEERVELLYVSSLGRMPSLREQAIAMRFLNDGDVGRINDRLADLFWAILNSAEFRLNH